MINRREIEDTNDNAANAKKEGERKETMKPESPDEPTRKPGLRPDNEDRDSDREKESQGQCLKGKTRRARISREKLNLIGVAEPGGGVAKKEKGQRATESQNRVAHKILKFYGLQSVHIHLNIRRKQIPFTPFCQFPLRFRVVHGAPRSFSCNEFHFTAFDASVPVPGLAESLFLLPNGLNALGRMVG